MRKEYFTFDEVKELFEEVGYEIIDNIEDVDPFKLDEDEDSFKILDKINELIIFLENPDKISGKKKDPKVKYKYNKIKKFVKELKELL